MVICDAFQSSCFDAFRAAECYKYKRAPQIRFGNHRISPNHHSCALGIDCLTYTQGSRNFSNTVSPGCLQCTPIVTCKPFYCKDCAKCKKETNHIKCCFPFIPASFLHCQYICHVYMIYFLSSPLRMDEITRKINS